MPNGGISGGPSGEGGGPATRLGESALSVWDSDAEAQAEYDGNPERQALLAKAMSEPTVRGERPKRRRYTEEERRVLGARDAEIHRRTGDGPGE